MSQLVSYTTDDGHDVVIEVADGPRLDGPHGSAPSGVVIRGFGDARIVEQTQQRLDDVLARTRPAVLALLRQVRGQEEAPDELEIEFGVQLSMEVGAYIAAASSSANFRVTMRWQRPHPA